MSEREADALHVLHCGLRTLVLRSRHPSHAFGVRTFVPASVLCVGSAVRPPKPEAGCVRFGTMRNILAQRRERVLCGEHFKAK